jgi:hypothetical protein
LTLPPSAEARFWTSNPSKPLFDPVAAEDTDRDVAIHDRGRRAQLATQVTRITFKAVHPSSSTRRVEGLRFRTPRRTVSEKDS